jgi:hypothetical protein
LFDRDELTTKAAGGNGVRVSVGEYVDVKEGVGVMVTVLVFVNVRVKVGVGIPSTLIQTSFDGLLSDISKLLKARIS